MWDWMEQASKWVRSDWGNAPPQHSARNDERTTIHNDDDDNPTQRTTQPSSDTRNHPSNTQNETPMSLSNSLVTTTIETVNDDNTIQQPHEDQYYTVHCPFCPHNPFTVKLEKSKATMIHWEPPLRVDGTVDLERGTPWVNYYCSFNNNKITNVFRNEKLLLRRHMSQTHNIIMETNLPVALQKLETLQDFRRQRPMVFLPPSNNNNTTTTRRRQETKRPGNDKKESTHSLQTAVAASREPTTSTTATLKKPSKATTPTKATKKASSTRNNQEPLHKKKAPTPRDKEPPVVKQSTMVDDRDNMLDTDNGQSTAVATNNKSDNHKKRTKNHEKALQLTEDSHPDDTDDDDQSKPTPNTGSSIDENLYYRVNCPHCPFFSLGLDKSKAAMIHWEPPLMTDGTVDLERGDPWVNFTRDNNDTRDVFRSEKVQARLHLSREHDVMLETNLPVALQKLETMEQWQEKHGVVGETKLASNETTTTTTEMTPKKCARELKDASLLLAIARSPAVDGEEKEEKDGQEKEDACLNDDENDKEESDDAFNKNMDEAHAFPSPVPDEDTPEEQRRERSLKLSETHYIAKCEYCPCTFLLERSVAERISWAPVLLPDGTVNLHKGKPWQAYSSVVEKEKIFADTKLELRSHYRQDHNHSGDLPVALQIERGASARSRKWCEPYRELQRITGSSNTEAPPEDSRRSKRTRGSYTKRQRLPEASRPSKRARTKPQYFKAVCPLCPAANPFFVQIDKAKAAKISWKPPMTPEGTIDMETGAPWPDYSQINGKYVVMFRSEKMEGRRHFWENHNVVMEGSLPVALRCFQARPEFAEPKGMFVHDHNVVMQGSLPVALRCFQARPEFAEPKGMFVHDHNVVMQGSLPVALRCFQARPEFAEPKGMLVHGSKSIPSAKSIKNGPPLALRPKHQVIVRRKEANKATRKKAGPNDVWIAKCDLCEREGLEPKVFPLNKSKAALVGWKPVFKEDGTVDMMKGEPWRSTTRIEGKVVNILGHQKDIARKHMSKVHRIGKNELPLALRTLPARERSNAGRGNTAASTETEPRPSVDETGNK